MTAASSSTPQHEVAIQFDVRVPMRDGITLSADIYRPKAAGTYPVILSRTPYLKTGKFGIDRGRWFAGHGYVYISMDVRGRGDSDGLFRPYFNDGIDGYDAIEWVAAQPWSTGDVATVGGSYSARIQWLTALHRPPHLRAMVASVAPSDPFVEVPTGTVGPMHLCWHHLTAGRVTQNMEAVDWAQIYTHLPLLTMDELAGRPSPHWREQLQHTQLDDFWAPLCYQQRFSEIDVPVLNLSGWYDDEQIGTPLNYMGMRRHGRTERARQGQRLLMGPWPHGVYLTPTQLGEVDFGPAAKVDLQEIELRWFDHWLKGSDNGLATEPPVRIFVMGENEWREETDWPLPDTRFTNFYLHSSGKANSRHGDGVLSVAAPGAELPDTYAYDPADPVPFLTEPTSSQIGGPDDYATVEERADVLVYTTPPLPEDVTVIGPVKLVLYGASSAPDTDFTAKLLDVHPSGFAQRLCDGMVRARFRDGMDKSQLIEPGRVYAYTIDLWNTAQVFKAGHCIRLEVASSAFPKYDRNLNTGGDIATGTELVVVQQTIYHDEARPSHLILPLIKR